MIAAVFFGDNGAVGIREYETVIVQKKEACHRGAGFLNSVH